MKDIKKVLGYQPTWYIGDGHGMSTAGKRTPNIPGVGVIQENEFNRPVCNLMESLATAVGFRVVQIAPELNEPGLRTRSGRVNRDFSRLRAANPHVLAHMLAVGTSVHYNALNGRFDAKKGGVEMFYHKTSANGKRLAQAVLKHTLHGFDQVSRGVKCNSLHMTRETNPVFILAELGFMDHLTEAKNMKDPVFQLECATEMLAGVCEYLGVDYYELLEADDVKGKAIEGPATATVEQAKAWAAAKGATHEFIALADLYWQIAGDVGLNPVGVYAQTAKETGFGRFGGVIDASYCNPCGLKVRSGGGNYDPKAHKRFKNWPEGIQAHVDHAALYAGVAGYPKKVTPDPRHFTWIAGKAKYWEDLSGKWAPSATYGTAVVKMMEQIEGVVIEDTNPVQERIIAELKQSLADATSKADRAEKKLKAVRKIVKEA